MPFFAFGDAAPRIEGLQALLMSLFEVDRRITEAPYVTLWLVDDIRRWVGRGFSLLVQLVDAYETLGDEFTEMQHGGDNHPVR